MRQPKHWPIDLYIDNIISSFDSRDEVLDYYREAGNIMSKAGFNLRSWTSNCDSLRSFRRAGIRKRHDTKDTWYEVERKVLQESSKIYDPLGLLSPVIIRAKIFMQKLWTRKCDWDEILTSEELLEWKNIADDLHIAFTTEISRHFFTRSARDMTDTKLHIFCDASQKAYGATVYLCTAEDSSMIMSKSRVTSLKKLTMPQIELLAAVLGIRHANYIHKALKVTKTIYWSDSQIVLHWISNTKSNNQFVKNTVKEINQNSSPDDWNYCPTDENSAANELLDNRLWWKGPHWISHEDLWPQWNLHRATNECEIKELTTFTTLTEASIADNEKCQRIDQIMNISRYSSLQKLYRVTAYGMRFIHNCKSNTQTIKRNHLKLEEIQDSEKKWIVSCQQQSFQEQIKIYKEFIHDKATSFV